VAVRAGTAGNRRLTLAGRLALLSRHLDGSPPLLGQGADMVVEQALLLPVFVADKNDPVVGGATHIGSVGLVLGLEILEGVAATIEDIDLPMVLGRGAKGGTAFG